MIDELDKAIQVAKQQWRQSELKLHAQERVLSDHASKTQEFEATIGSRDEQIASLTSMNSLLTSQRDEAQYNLGRTAKDLDIRKADVIELTDAVRRLERQVDNLRATMGLENA